MANLSPSTTTVITASDVNTVTKFDQRTCTRTTTVAQPHKRQIDTSPTPTVPPDAQEFVDLVVRQVASNNTLITTDIYDFISSALLSACSCADFPEPLPTTVTTDDIPVVGIHKSYTLLEQE